MRGPSKSRQIPLELGHAPGLSRDDLIVSAANEAAVALLDQWPDWPAPVVILVGPAGAGKSHLAAIWQEISGARRVDATRVLADDIAAAASAPVLVDDIAPGTIDEQGLFHLVNAARQGGTKLLLTARRFPAAWGVTLPDLASRLKAAAAVEIAEPDDLLLAGVVTKLFADRQIEVEPHVVRFVARRMERSLSTAIRVVDELDRAALETKSRITRPLAAEALGRLEGAGRGAGEG